jgi:general secretion pathway protein J
VRRAGGFTLIEILVAVAILAVAAAITYTGLASALTTRERAAAAAERTTALQKAYLRLRNDLQQLRARPSRDPFGEMQPALALLEEGAIEFTRSGWRNPLSLPRSSLERVAYRIDDEQRLVRASWRAIDRAQNAPVAEAIVLEQVEELRWRFLEGDEWRDRWPPATAEGGAALGAVPRAVEVTLLLKDLGEVRLLFSATNAVRK